MFLTRAPEFAHSPEPHLPQCTTRYSDLWPPRVKGPWFACGTPERDTSDGARPGTTVSRGGARDRTNAGPPLLARRGGRPPAGTLPPDRPPRRPRIPFPRRRVDRSPV